MKKTKIFAATALMTLFGFSHMEAMNDIEVLKVDINEIVYVEEEEEIDLGFNHHQYLPIGFNAYEGMALDLNTIEYIECDEEIILDFNAEDYLPSDFDPYARPI
jgi:hypothetical protein